MLSWNIYPHKLTGHYYHLFEALPIVYQNEMRLYVKKHHLQGKNVTEYAGIVPNILGSNSIDWHHRNATTSAVSPFPTINRSTNSNHEYLLLLLLLFTVRSCA